MKFNKKTKAHSPRSGEAGKPQTKHGQSIIEILVAITIGGLIIGSAVVAIRLSLRSSTQVQTVGSATPLMSSLIDNAKSVAEGSWNTLYNLSNKGADSKYYFVRDNGLKIIEGEEGVLGEDIVSGLVGYWKFDETTGTTAYDVSPNNNKGTLTNSPSRTETTSCKIGRCLSFDGSDDFVDMGFPSSSLSFQNNVFTFAFWMKSNATTSDNTPGFAVLGKREGSGLYEYSISREPSDSAGAGRFKFYAWTSSGSGVYNTTTAAFDNNWNHYVWTADGTNAYVYRNGILVTGPISRNGSNTMSNTTSPLKIGRGGDANPIVFFDGLIDDVRAYNRFFSASEAFQLYTSKIYTRSFSVEDVGRTSCGRGDISSSAIVQCTDGNQISEDPSTQKITATVTPAIGSALSATEYLVRSKNSTNLFTDWSGIRDNTGVYTTPTSNYSSIDPANPVDVSTPGQITLP